MKYYFYAHLGIIKMLTFYSLSVPKSPLIKTYKFKININFKQKKPMRIEGPSLLLILKSNENFIYGSENESITPEQIFLNQYIS